MKKTILFLVSILFIATTFTSCGEDEKLDPIENESSFHLIFDTTTITEEGSGSGACANGHFYVSGKAADGTTIIIEVGEIFIGETRTLCDEDDTACIDNNGIELSRFYAFSNYYSIVSGTATRVSSSKIEMSGVVSNNSNSEEHHNFTLEATVGTVTTSDCD